jgi:steroid 5-alpha reductase family enzyme
VRNVTFLEMYAIGAGEVVGIIALLEKTLATTKPGYKDYVESTSAFIPWFPRKRG